MEKANKMGTMPVGKLLFSLSAPAMLSMMINSLYNVIDSIFVARYSEAALTAVSFVSPIQLLMIAVGVGTAVGINSLVSRRLGAGRLEDANEAASSGLKLGVVNWIFFALICGFGAKAFMGLFTDDPTIFSDGVTYMRIIGIGSLFTMVGINIEKIFQSTGNMIYPMITMITGAVINTLVDPLLIFGLGPFPELGVAGAAISTVFAQLCGFLTGLFLLTKKFDTLQVKVFTKDVHLPTIKEIYAVGAPSIIMQGLGSVLLFAMNGILASFSATAVAVMGVYGKLQGFIFMPCFGLNQGALPMMGYNYGARNKKRLMDTYKIAVISAICIMLVGLTLFQTMPGTLLKLFDAQGDMYDMGINALRKVSLCFIPAAFGIISASFMQATGHGFTSMWGSIIRQFAGVLPLALIFGKIGGVNMVWFAYPGAEVLGVAYYSLLMIYIYNKKIKNMGC